MMKLVIREPGKKLYREFQLETGTYTLGRDRENDIAIEDEAVSRLHAQIRYEDEAFTLEDLQSKAGVYVNKVKIEGKTPLAEGDEILIGVTEITFESELESAMRGGDDKQTVVIDAATLQKHLAGEEDDIRDTTVTDEPDLPDADESDGDTSIIDGDAGKTRIMGMEEILAPSGQESHDRTVLLDPGETISGQVTNYHKLLVVSEGGFGKEYVIAKPETKIGRDPECDITLDDGTVSGVHAIVSLEGEKCRVADNASKNGTLLNDRPLQKESFLRKGDEVRIGETTFKFVHKDSALSKEELLKVGSRKAGKGGPSRKGLIAVLGTLGFVLLLITVTKMTKGPEGGEGAASTVEEEIVPLAPPPAPSQPAKKMAADAIAKSTADIYFETANEFMKNRLWEEAIAKFDDVANIDPAYVGVQDGMYQAKKELANREFFEEGLMLANRKRWDEGIEKLSSIPEGSIYRGEAALEIQFARDEIERDAAKKRAAKVKKAAKKSAAPVKKAVKPPVSLSRKAKENVRQALNYYVKGDTKLAIAKLNSVINADLKQDDPARRDASFYKSKIQGVLAVYGRGLIKYHSREFSEAFRIWSEALQIDQEIIGKKKSHLSNRIAIYLADEFYRQAKEAYEDGRYADAADKCRDALKAKPGHEGSIEIAKLLDGKARKLYEDGYILEDLNPKEAVEKWTLAVKISSPENRYHKKAKANLAKYKAQGRGGR